MNSKRKPTTYRFPSELDEQISKMAQEEGLSKNAFLQQLLRNILLKSKKTA